MPEYEPPKRGFFANVIHSTWDKATHDWEEGHLARKSKELFLFGAADPRYNALPGQNWIRLLRLEAGAPGTIVKCTLREVNLDEEPVYTALSYTWKQDPGMWIPFFNKVKDMGKS